MKFHIFQLLITAIALPAFAQENTLNCDGKGAIDRVEIKTENKVVDAQLCQQGDEVVLVTEEPIKRQHLLYGGLNLGMPYLLGAELTYVQKNGNEQIFHISSALEGSLGSNGVAVRGGYHPFGNAFFIGGTARGYQGLPGEGGLQAGPTIGLSTGGKFISGHIGVSYLAGYDSRAGGLATSPEFVMGLRIRLLKTPRK